MNKITDRVYNRNSVGRHCAELELRASKIPVETLLTNFQTRTRFNEPVQLGLYSLTNSCFLLSLIAEPSNLTYHDPGL